MNQSPYRYSFVIISAINDRPCVSDAVGLKANWEAINWSSMGLPATAISSLISVVACCDSSCVVHESFAMPEDNIVHHGFEIVLLSPTQISPGMVTTIQMACIEFIRSIMNDPTPLSMHLDFSGALTGHEREIVTTAQTRFLEEFGDRFIPIPFFCDVAETRLPCDGKYGAKPPLAPRQPEFSSVVAHFVAEDSESKTCKLKCVDDKKSLVAKINLGKDLWHIHSRLFDGNAYVVHLRSDFGMDGKATLMLISIGDIVEPEQPRLI